MKKYFLLFILLSSAGLINAQTDSMIHVGNIYVDQYEAPNIKGELPFVMFNFNEACSWCQARGKRLLYDDEWEMVAGGPSALPYVYGTTYDSSACNDNKVYIAPNFTLINQWPFIPYLDTIQTFSELIDSVRNVSASAAQSADEVMRLYQADTAGRYAACVSYYGIYDLNGNVYEWTIRRDGGTTSNHGNLKGGYWSWPSTTTTDILSHADGYRYCYTGFRCASDSIITSVHASKNKMSFYVYPNPAYDQIFIDINGKQPLQEYTISVFSIHGELLLVQNASQAITKIDISILKKGLYILKISSDESSEVKRFVKI